MVKQLEKINQQFSRLGGLIVRFRWPVLITYAIITIIAGYGMTLIKMDNAVESYFPEGTEIMLAQDRFEDIFGNSEYIAFLVESEDVFTHDVLTMIRELGQELERSVPYADKVISISNMEFSRAVDEDIFIEDLVPDPVPEDPSEILAIKDLALSKKQLINVMYSEDATQTWIMLRLYPFPDDWEEQGLESPSNAVGKKVLDILAQEEYSGYNMKSVGMPILAWEELQYMEKEMGILTILAFVLSIIILGIFLRSVRGVVIPLITTISSIVIVFGAMGFLGIKVNSTMLTVPVFLGFAVSIGYSIHLFNFFTRDFAINGSRKEAVYYSLEQSAWPLLFTAITTMAGLLSFVFVSLIPIQWLGLTSAAVILSVYIGVMIMTTILLSFGKDKKVIEAKTIKALRTDKYFMGLGSWVTKHAVPIIIIYCVVSLFFVYGLTKIKINVDTKNSYGKRVPYINKMLEVARSKIGSLMSYNIAIEFDEPDMIKDPEVLHNLERLNEKVMQFKNTKRTSSILDIIKDMNQMLNEDNPEQYRIPETKAQVAELIFLYELSGGTEAGQWVDSNYSVLRVMVEIDDMDFLEISKEVDLIKELCTEMFPDAEFSITGGMIQFAELNYYVAVGQIKSILIALAIILILLVIVFRSLKTGLIGLVPNITPTIIVGGLMGYLKIPLDMLTITMMPMIMGLAVDATIHYISHINLEYNKTGNYRDSIMTTSKLVGKALFMSSFIIMAAFAIYTTSTVRMFITMGIFIVVGIGSALIADYLVTPSLIYLTKPFGPNNLTNNNQGDEK